MSLSRRDVLILAALFLVTRVALVIVGVLAMSVLGVKDDPSYTRLLDNVPALDMWHRWDAGFYTNIATDGYTWEREGQPSYDMAFLPGYPLAIRAVSGLTPNGCTLSAYLSTCGTIGGLFISNLSLLGALILIFDLALALVDKKTAWCTAILLLLTPISIFLSGVYSEALFMFLSVLSFWCLKQDRDQLGIYFLGAVIAASLASLTRSVGVALFPALLWYVWQATRTEGSRITLNPRSISRFLLAALPILAFGGYILWMGLRLGSPGAFFQGYQQFWGRELDPVQAFTRYFTPGVRVDLFGWWDSWIDPAATIFFLVLALIVFLRLKREWGIFALIAVLIPIMSGSLLSAPRYGAALFPFYILIGRWIARLERRWQQGIVYAVASGAALLFLVRFVTWRWIA